MSGKTWWELTDEEAALGETWARVPVPPTIDMTGHFREIYEQGYRHALSDARTRLKLERARDAEELV